MFYYQSVYSYDIPACHFNILKNSGFDVSHLPENDKLERNKMIGLMMRENRELTNFLRETTKQIIDYYIQLNNLKKEELLLRQYDGFYTTRKLTLKHYEGFPAKLEEKNFYQVFLFSINKAMYIAKSGNDLLVKGVPDKYDEMNKLYDQLLQINFMSKQSISTSLNYLKNYLLTTNNLNMFLIPIKNSLKIYIEEFGEMIVGKRAVKMIQIDEIDRYQYFKIYLEPFFKAIVFDLF